MSDRIYIGTGHDALGDINEPTAKAAAVALNQRKDGLMGPFKVYGGREEVLTFFAYLELLCDWRVLQPWTCKEFRGDYFDMPSMEAVQATAIEIDQSEPDVSFFQPYKPMDWAILR